MTQSNRTPEQINSQLDRTEAILADLTVRLDRLEGAVEANTIAIAALTDRVDRVSVTVENLADGLAVTNASVDRLASVFARYMDQATIERDYQRTVNREVRDRLDRFESESP
jgi:ABC-type transporter Mla subunit MlaD